MTDDKPMFTKKFTAEFNTGQDTLRQIATMEWNIDEMFRMVYTGGINKSDTEGIKNIHHYLVYVYADRLYSMAWETTHKEFREYEKKLKELYDDWMNNPNNRSKVPRQLLDELRLYKRWLYEVKQKRLKMGVPTREETTAKERLNRVAGV